MEPFQILPGEQRRPAADQKRNVVWCNRMPRNTSCLISYARGSAALNRAAVS
jgi:hypothetical protein